MLKKVHCSSDSIKLKIFASQDVLSISLIRAIFGKIEFQETTMSPNSGVQQGPGQAHC